MVSLRPERGIGDGMADGEGEGRGKRKGKVGGRGLRRYAEV